MKESEKCLVYEYLFKKMQQVDNDYKACLDDVQSQDVFPSDYSAASVALARKLEIEEIVCDLFNLFRMMDAIDKTRNDSFNE